MATLHETAYPRLKTDPTRKELDEIYTPTPTELTFVNATAHSPATRLAVLIHLKLFQRLGYFLPLAAIPAHITRHMRVGRDSCKEPRFRP